MPTTIGQRPSQQGDDEMDELRERIAVDRQMISTGERPLYHATTSYDGSAVDVRVRELPIIHLFVPDTAGVLDGARGLIARTLGVAPTSFDVTADEA
jgi:hypothetical protein